MPENQEKFLKFNCSQNCSYDVYLLKIYLSDYLASCTCNIKYSLQYVIKYNYQRYFYLGT